MLKKQTEAEMHASDDCPNEREKGDVARMVQVGGVACGYKAYPR